ncbi:MAG: ribonuclease Y [Anaerolineae bacterium]|nr:ribonuclease Y [Anaerolineae bacterium]MBN8618511.1 ribonuclease Y [Anaerolineae bacterium]
MEIGVLVLGLLIGLALGTAIGVLGLNYYQNSRGKNRAELAEAEARRIVSTAQGQADATVREADDKAKSILEESEQATLRRRRELDKEDERLQKRREDLDNRFERLEQREQNLNKRQSRMDKQQNDLQKLEEQRLAELQRIAQMTIDEARKELLGSVERDARSDMARIIRQVEAEAREEADNRARDVISLAVQRLASEHVSEIAVSVVPLPSDEMKGRIIGRAGRNIRAFELATGVDVVVDDTPEAVTISSFDPVRREVAKRALAKLVVDGRIHPARIEKLVEDAQVEVEQSIREEGERAAYEAGIPGLHPEVIKLLGRLKFRTSYGQNQHAHSIETAHIAGMIAAELGADVATAKAGGLLHDIGKAIDHEVEGTHALIGADFAKRYGVNAKVVNCIASHHHEVEQECVEAYIVEAADAISGARPGARRESMETYIKRVKTLEDIANSFQGVEQSYALQAGREVRIIVRPDVVDDFSSLQLAREIARKIEESMQYPGQIKVQVIRETRAVDFAK